MIKLFLKYKCPGCSKPLWRPVKGFLGHDTAHSTECKSRLMSIAEHQFSIWGYTPGELKQFYYRVSRQLTQLGIPIVDIKYTDFIIWLFIKHGSTRQTLDRIYTGLMEDSHGRVGR